MKTTTTQRLSELFNEDYAAKARNGLIALLVKASTNDALGLTTTPQLRSDALYAITLMEAIEYVSNDSALRYADELGALGTYYAKDIS